MIDPLTAVGWLVATLAIELALAAFLTAAHRPTLGALLGLNLISHPLGLWALSESIPWVAVESAVLLFEAWGLRVIAGRSGIRAITLATVVNVVTAAVGFACT